MLTIVKRLPFALSQAEREAIRAFDGHAVSLDTIWLLRPVLRATVYDAEFRTIISFPIASLSHDIDDACPTYGDVIDVVGDVSLQTFFALLDELRDGDEVSVSASGDVTIYHSVQSKTYIMLKGQS